MIAIEDASRSGVEPGAAMAWRCLGTPPVRSRPAFVGQEEIPWGDVAVFPARACEPAARARHARGCCSRASQEE